MTKKLIIEQSLEELENILWNMECILRTKEGITGINALYHINLILLIRILDDKLCNKFNIPKKFSFNKLKKLNAIELFNIFNNKDNNLLYYLFIDNRFGFSEDIPFEIKNKNTLHYLIVKSKDIQIKNLLKKDDIIGNIYEKFVNKESKTMQTLGQYFTDRQIVNFMIKLTKPKFNNNKIETMYDGSAGTGGFLIQYISYLNKNFKNIDWNDNKYNIFANELSKNTFSLLKLNMFLSTNLIFENIFLNDSLTNDNSMDNGYDIILMNPPFASKGIKYKEINNKIKSIKINATHGIVLFVQHCMTNLSQNGRCCIIIPEGFLYNSNKMYRETRKYLLEHFDIKKIIKLGDGNFFRNTKCRTSILYFENNGNKTSSIQYSELNKINNSTKEDLKFEINIKDIEKHNFSLNVNLYKQTNINSNFPIFSINEICLLKNGKNISKKNRKGTLYPYYGSNGISGYVDEYLYDGEYLLHGDQGSILNSLKIVNTKFYPGNHTLVFKPKDTSQINTKFLYYYFKLFVDIKSITSGTVIPEIRKEDFRNIKIIIPPINLQNELVQKLDNLNEKLNISLDLPKEILLKNMNEFILSIEQQGKTIFKQLFN